jgi:TatD DNase family protein
MRSLPTIDAHAHIKADLDPTEIATLDGVIFAATRSLDEAAIAVERNDERVLWGVGCHPGLVGVQRSFDIDRFESLIGRTPIVSEIGMDGSSRVAAAIQRRNFEAILRSLQNSPRIVSVHSYQATTEVLNSIEEHGGSGIILHWWLGDSTETERALNLGCYFSVNSSSRSLELLDQIPASRVLPETDHPFGDRRGRAAARPGNVADVESRLLPIISGDVAAVRLQMWRNLLALATETSTLGMFPRAARLQFAAV